MKKPDLLKMCFQNLKRRKARTLLTSLGVLIGCCSILVMVSIGFGMKEGEEQFLKKMGDLTIITVTRDENSQQGKPDQELVDTIKQMEGVSDVSPKIELNGYAVRAYAGINNRYQSDYLSIAGIDTTKIKELGYKTAGEYTELKTGEVLIGQDFVYGFRDSLRPEESNKIEYSSLMDEDEEKPEGYFDPYSETITLEIARSDGTANTSDSAGTGSEKKASLRLNPVGSCVSDIYKGYETVGGMIMNIEDLQTLISQISTPGSTDIAYDAVIVKVSELSMVEPVENAIRQLGCNTQSMTEYRKNMQEESRNKQMMFGGIGAISLFVAALGIMNTMIMSISERTKEIGIMKSLGCYISDIRLMFLAEAGSIGMIGGIVGCVISFLASVVINLTALGGLSAENIKAAIIGGENITRLSVIPIWLYAFAILFSIFVGVASGYYPANKAVKIPALEAIKSE